MNRDLHIAKAKENAGIRQSRWWPTLSITPSGRLTMYHAIHNCIGQRQQTEDDMLVTLGWEWDGRKGAKYFYTKLSQESLKNVLNLWTDYSRLYLNLSEGVREWQQANS